MAKSKLSSPASKRAAAVNKTPVPKVRPRYSGVMDRTSNTGSLAGDIAAALPKPETRGGPSNRKYYIGK
jgi:hypothetical protein